MKHGVLEDSHFAKCELSTLCPESAILVSSKIKIFFFYTNSSLNTVLQLSLIFGFVLFLISFNDGLLVVITP